MRTTAAGLLLLAAGILLQGCRYDLSRTWPDRGIEASLSFPDAALPDARAPDQRLADGGPADAGDAGLDGDAMAWLDGAPCSSSCPGCCQADACIPLASQDPNTCGSGGAACAACPAAPECNAMACLQGVCTPAKVAAETPCAGGRCDSNGSCCKGCLSNGQCASGYDPWACGIAGNPCQVCSGGAYCVAGTCQYLYP
jgi:hypothetical protein